ncbi:MAG: TetR/AcrR family transcriptional regulator [Caulobacteraceae bacterium]|nr:TetR/AcrR family transcriptional regulator [Caulobacteraceae bacterium]
MPRVAGQIDAAKTEAILDAAGDVLAERGLAAPIGEIARRAGVAKQTIYNRYGCKAALIRAMIERRVDLIAAPLLVASPTDPPEDILADFGRSVLKAITQDRGAAVMRVSVQGAAALPDVALDVFEAGPRGSRRRLADYLRQEAAAGRLAIDDPGQAAEFFAGMVIGSHQLAVLFGVKTALDDGKIDHIAREAARRFVRAYAA